MRRLAGNERVPVSFPASVAPRQGRVEVALLADSAQELTHLGQRMPWMPLDFATALRAYGALPLNPHTLEYEDLTLPVDLVVYNAAKSRYVLRRSNYERLSCVTRGLLLYITRQPPRVHIYGRTL